MNLKNSLSGFKRINWDNKTTKDKQKTLINQYEKLGLKVPKYLQKNTLSERNFESAINRINKTYDKRIEKQSPKIKLKDLQYLANKHNALVDRKIKQLENKGYSKNTIDFLKGERIFLSITDRAIQKNNALLEKINLDNYYSTPKGRKEYARQIKEKTKKLNNLNLITDEKTSSKNLNKFNDILNSENLFYNTSDNDIKHIYKIFENMNIVQQEISLNSILSEFKEKYEGEELEGEYLLNTLNKLSRNLMFVKENI